MHPQASDSATTPASAEPPVRAFVIVLGLAIVHAWAVWGHTGTFWFEHGRWLHTLTRFAAGEVPYRDFVYPNPPLGLWVIGGLVKVFGTSFATITMIMTAWYLGIMVVFLLALRRLVPDLVLPIAVPALLFAASFAVRAGISLPAGTESPAGPVGFLCILGSAWLILATVESPSVGKAFAAGALAGLAVLSKHDFWLAALYLTIAGGLFMRERGARAAVQAAAPLGFAGSIAVGTAILIAQAGFGPVAHMYGGSGHAIEIALRSTPSLERLTVEIAATAALALTAVVALWLCLAISDRAMTRWAGVLMLAFLTSAATHMGMSVAIGRNLLAGGSLPEFPTITQDALWQSILNDNGLFSSALVLFDYRLQSHLFPVILPPILLVVLIARWNLWHDPKIRWRLALLLGLCIVARTRRGFSGADWYNVLLDLPAYALYLRLICGPATQKAARAVRAALSVLIVLGIYAYLSLAVGKLTLQGSNPRTVTHRGTVRWTPIESGAYRVADSLVQRTDPSGRRPLYAMGASGGWNYFLVRDNPLPFTAGLTSGNPVLRDSATARLRASPLPPLLLYNSRALRPRVGAASLFDWEPPATTSIYVRYDLPWFVSVAQTCNLVGGDSAAAIRLYDCRW